MRAMMVGLLAGVLVTWTLDHAAPNPPKVYAQRFVGSDASASQQSDLVAIAGSVVEGQQSVLLVDTRRQTLGSYQVDAKTGQIALRSVRNIRWDLEMDEFNGMEPTPQKIQALLQSR
jgi:hypothetical protein